MWTGFKRFLLWDYERGVWQYDVMCAIILLFMAFAPRQWFHDQPKIPQASQIAEGVFWLEPVLVESIPEKDRTEKLGKYLSGLPGEKKVTLSRIEKVVDSENEVIGYTAFSRK